GHAGPAGRGGAAGHLHPRAPGDEGGPHGRSPVRIVGRMKPSVPRVLCADDQPDLLQALQLLLKNEGFAVVTAGSPAAALAAVEGEDLDAALIDLNYARDTTSGREGL